MLMVLLMMMSLLLLLLVLLVLMLLFLSLLSIALGININILLLLESSPLFLSLLLPIVQAVSAVVIAVDARAYQQLRSIISHLSDDYYLLRIAFYNKR